MSKLGAKVAYAVFETMRNRTAITPVTNAIAAADRQLVPLVALLERCRDREYNPFEQCNQSALHADLCAAIRDAQC